MVSLLSKIFIKNRDDVTDSAVRKAYGSLCSALGIVLNVLLFAGKYIAGVVFLGSHLLVELGGVGLETVLAQDELGEVEREAVGVIKFEGDLSANL